MWARRPEASVHHSVGIGLRAPHMAEVLTTRPPLGWFEVHAENYLGGGLPLAQLAAVRRDYPISLHAVGLSLGSAEGIDHRPLARLAALAERIEPCLVSDHLSWSCHAGTYLNDLLPLPLTEESLALVAANLDAVQEVLRRPLLIENPSSYLRFRHSTIPEPEFLAELARRSGCRLLLDVNNIHVTCSNLGGDGAAYIGTLPPGSVAEIHLAGHCRTLRGGQRLLIDDHGATVAPPVWDLYRQALARFGRVPSLVEWDKQLPDLSVLLEEARKAEWIADKATEARRDHAA